MEQAEAARHNLASACYLAVITCECAYVCVRWRGSPFASPDQMKCLPHAGAPCLPPTLTTSGLGHSGTRSGAAQGAHGLGQEGARANETRREAGYWHYWHWQAGGPGGQRWQVRSATLTTTDPCLQPHCLSPTPCAEERPPDYSLARQRLAPTPFLLARTGRFLRCSGAARPP